MQNGPDARSTHLSGPNVREARSSYIEEQYPVMIQSMRLRAADLRRMRSEASTFRYAPLVSLLLPVSDPEPERLEQTLDSVLGQIYPAWELCVCVDAAGAGVNEALSLYERLDGRVRVARQESHAGVVEGLNTSLSLAAGEFAGVLSPGDELAPEALFEIVELLQEEPYVDLVYSDEDELDEKGVRSNPRFKPGWSPDLLLSIDYVSRLSIYRRSLIVELGGIREGFAGQEEYDLVLRATERTDRIRHVPKVLYHRRAGSPAPRAGESGHRALSEALGRRGLDASVENGLLPDRYRVRFAIKGEPKVSLIIPTRDNVSLLKNCVESVERLTAYPNYEILIVDNDSVDPATLDYLASTPHRVLPFKEKFNYSRINNFGVSKAEGEYVLLLNDDTEVTSGDWLEAMLEHAQRPEVGAVGAKLLYPDDRIQHAGVLVGVGNPWGPGVAVHSHQFYPSDSPGYAGLAATTANCSAVTAACMLLRKSVFDEVGGLDEENLHVSFNDVDLCLRIREKGYWIVCTPHAQLYHHESVSRGYGVGDPTEPLYMNNRWGETLREDPFYNPNFSGGSGDYNIRADLLRPWVLWKETEQLSGSSQDSFKNLLTTSRDKLGEYVAMQQRVARSSRRTTIVPGREKETPRIAALEDLENDEGSGLPREKPPSDPPPRAAAARSGEAFTSRKPLRAEQLVWMFGSPRTGSTWLSRMMAEFTNQERWHEPYIGLLFGSFLYERLEGNEKLLNSPSFIMGEPYRDVWLSSIRDFLLRGAEARYPRLKEDQFLVIKEPNGSIGAPLLMEATPESRMIFLIRDSKDVVASRLDAFKEGAWSTQYRNYGSAEELNAFTRHLAEDYFKVVSQVERAYEAHRGRKALMRYEDLRDDTIGTIEAMYAALEIEVDVAQLKAAVAKHSWEQIPDSQKGAGKFYRKAEPGSWRTDLSSDQVRLIEEITGPLVSRYY